MSTKERTLRTEKWRGLKEIGFGTSKADRCVYHIKIDEAIAFLLTYVDDFFLLGPNIYMLGALYSAIEDRFEIKKEPLKKLEIERTEKGIFLHQASCIEEVLKQHEMDACKRAPTPMTANLQLRQQKPCNENPQYQTLVGQLLFLARCTWPTPPVI